MNEKKIISILIACFNEEENVVPMSEAVVELMETQLSQYNYEILFIDNCSTDNTQPLLRTICAKNPKIKAIFNTKNFGQFRSPYYGICQTSGDCTVCLCCDFQDPLDMIPVFVEEWENGYKIVSGIKTTSKENKILYFLRSCYYKVIKKMSDVEMIEHFTGFGLYDKSFVDVLRNLNDPTPFLRGIVAELGPKRKDVPYEQQKRLAGKSHNNMFTLYDAAMLSFTSYTKVGLRLASIFGFILSGLSILGALLYFILKLIYWERYIAGTVPILLAVLVFGSVQIFLIGLVGEYIMNMNTRIINRPLVVEEERINLDEDKIAQERKITVFR